MYLWKEMYYHFRHLIKFYKNFKSPIGVLHIPKGTNFLYVRKLKGKKMLGMIAVKLIITPPCNCSTLCFIMKLTAIFLKMRTQIFRFYYTCTYDIIYIWFTISIMLILNSEEWSLGLSNFEPDFCLMKSKVIVIVDGDLHVLQLHSIFVLWTCLAVRLDVLWDTAL